jgi:RsiW-degrading membrane proteinase PrsW (M82 family)
MDNNFLIYTILALLPGLVWLLYFLRKDTLPEPKKQIVKVFIWGMAISIPTILCEMGLLADLSALTLDNKTYYLIKYIFIIGLVEELAKYIAIRFSIIKSSHIDEPIDIPIYMIVAALGFATAENILVFCTQTFLVMQDPILLSFSRFIGANLLHALCSGIIGYFLALSFYYLKQRHIILFIGFSLSIILHGFFDFFLESSIIKEMGNTSFSPVMYSIYILIGMFILLTFALRRIKKLKSVCKL